MAWRSAYRKAEEAGYTFKVPKHHPRNPDNQPDEFESRVLSQLSSGQLEEYYEIDESINSIRYFRPIKLTQACMLCHGDPKMSSVYWGNDEGLDPTGGRMANWKVGEVHGAFEVVQSLNEADAKIAASLRFGGVFVALAFLAMAVVFFFVINRAVNRPISRIVKELGQGSAQVGSAAGEVSSTSQSMAQDASEQAASIEEVSSSLEEMSSMTQQNAAAAEELNSQALALGSSSGNLSTLVLGEKSGTPGPEDY